MTPAQSTPSAILYNKDPYLHKILVVSDLDRPDVIANQLKQAMKERDEIKTRLPAIMKTMYNRAFKLWDNFLTLYDINIRHLQLPKKHISFEFKKSVTPNDDGAMKVLKAKLSEIGFSNIDLPFGSKKNNNLILNLFSVKNSKKLNNKLLCFAGHTDVVPEGDSKKWKFDPFLGKVSGGKLHGRGASDMKGAIAAWVMACNNILKKKKLNIALALLITGDEEGVATNGTIKVVQYLKQKKIKINHCIVGEPTNPNYIGEMIKVGRRGSLSFSIETIGKYGHVAYPHLAKNPVTSLIHICNKLNNLKLNLKAKNFPQTNLEVTSVDTGNPTSNVIPNSCKALINIRYNTRYNEKLLLKKIKASFSEVPCTVKLKIISSNKPFYTKSDKFLSLLEKSI